MHRGEYHATSSAHGYEPPRNWKSVALATCLLAAFVPCSVQAADAVSPGTDNEIKNGDFNSGLASWECESTVENARKNTSRKAFSVIADGTDGPDLKVLEVKLDPKEMALLSQKFRVSSRAENLTVSFRYKASSDYKPLSYYTVHVSVGHAVSADPASAWPRVIAGEPWKEFSCRYSLRGGKQPSLTISVRGGTGKFFLDDIKVTAEGR